MKQEHRKNQSITFLNAPVIVSWASVAGKKESEGPLAGYYDHTSRDSYFGEKTWEQGEKRMQQLVLQTVAQKANIQVQDISLVFSGDLLNQCIGSSFTLRNLQIPHLGLYGACSTMAESLMLSAMTVNAGYFSNVAALTSSHFASSERQYRFPLNYGGQRPPTSQWTVTGAGGVLLRAEGNGPVVTGCTIGNITDLGIKDANNMGAAMAPAAFDTIFAHFRDFQVDANDYDLIITGDLGQLGKDILITLCAQNGIPIGGKYTDCGTLVFDTLTQDVHCGGSGCGCSAIALCGYLLEKMQKQKLKKILFCGTGALLSPLSTQQGLTIPAVCHAVSIERKL